MTASHEGASDLDMLRALLERLDHEDHAGPGDVNPIRKVALIVGRLVQKHEEQLGTLRSQLEQLQQSRA